MKYIKQILALILLFALVCFFLHFHFHIITEHTENSEHRGHCPFIDIVGGFLHTVEPSIVFLLVFLCIAFIFDINPELSLSIDSLRNKAPPVSY